MSAAERNAEQAPGSDAETVRCLPLGAAIRSCGIRFEPFDEYMKEIETIMKKVKITVLRATFNEDLALEYGMPGLKPCSVMKQGQVFYAAHAKPDGFCDGAWRTIYQYVFALANGARSFYYNDWIRQPGVAIACCNDGLRPVFFKLEATDEEVGAPIDS